MDKSNSRYPKTRTAGKESTESGSGFTGFAMKQMFNRTPTDAPQSQADTPQSFAENSTHRNIEETSIRINDDKNDNFQSASENTRQNMDSYVQTKFSA